MNTIKNLQVYIYTYNKMARDNNTNISFDFSSKEIEELKTLYKEAEEKRRNWVNFRNKRISTNLICYIINYSENEK